MTLFVSKAILQAMGACQEGQAGIDWLVNDLGKGDENFKMPYDDFLSAIRNVDKPQEEKVMWYQFIKDLKDRIEFYEQQGAIVMQEKYQVFNTLTGQYEVATSLDEARIIRQRIKDEFIAANASLFVINQEAYIQDEDRSLWKVVE